MKQLSSRELDDGLSLLSLLAEGLALDEAFAGCAIVCLGLVEMSCVTDFLLSENEGIEIWPNWFWLPTGWVTDPDGT